MKQTSLAPQEGSVVSASHLQLYFECTLMDRVPYRVFPPSFVFIYLFIYKKVFIIIKGNNPNDHEFWVYAAFRHSVLTLHKMDKPLISRIESLIPDA